MLHTQAWKPIGKSIAVRNVILSSAILLLAFQACTPTHFRESVRPPKLEVFPDTAAESVPAARPMLGAAYSRGEKEGISVESLYSLPAHIGPINAIDVSGKGDRLITGGQDGQVYEFVSRTDSGGLRRFERKKLLGGVRPVLALSLSPDGKKLAVAQFSSVTIVDLEEGEISAQLSRVIGQILALDWDPRGESVVLGRANGDVFLWNLQGSPYAGSDNDNALEVYQAATSPIVGLSFHPSGRAFFAAEREGRVNFWRILRTERELGLRDELALSDQNRRGATQIPLGQIPGQIATLWLSPDGVDLYAMSLEGVVYSWRVRGLQLGPSIELGSDSSLAFIGGFERLRVPARAPVFYAAGRGGYFGIWCRRVKAEYAESPRGFSVIGEPAQESRDRKALAAPFSVAGHIDLASGARRYLPAGLGGSAEWRCLCLRHLGSELSPAKPSEILPKRLIAIPCTSPKAKGLKGSIGDHRDLPSTPRAERTSGKTRCQTASQAEKEKRR